MAQTRKSEFPNQYEMDLSDPSLSALQNTGVLNGGIAVTSGMFRKRKGDVLQQIEAMRNEPLVSGRTQYGAMTGTMPNLPEQTFAAQNSNQQKGLTR